MKQHALKSLWSKTATPLEPSPALLEDQNCDVTIIGAGFTGLRAALKLAEAGLKVIVLDAGDVGWGASGRSGGQVNPMLPISDPDKLHNLVGTKYFESITETSLNSADELFELIEKYQIDCQARQHGWLRVNHSEKVIKQTTHNAEKWNRYGANMRFVEGNELQTLTGSSVYKTGILTPEGGAVHPMSLVRGLAKVVRGAGAQIFGSSPVNALKQTSSGWNTQTTSGCVSSKWVILATNGYTDGLLKGLKNSLFPLLPIQIATEPLEDARIDTILPKGQTISDTRRVIMYARREPDNRFVFGGLGNLSLQGKIGGYEWLQKDAERIYPSLKGVKWDFKWGGKIAITHDRIPHFHEPAPGLITGLGYNGRGVALSHVIGRMLADRVLGTALEDLPFPVTKIKRIPFRTVQMIGKSTAIGWMRFLDRLEIS